MRGSINQKTAKLLFARSGGICAFPDCGTRLVVQNSGALIGEMCHISAASPAGPRFDPALSDKQRNEEDNFIILCPTHHSLIDQDPTRYTAETLKLMKADHEAKVFATVADSRTTVADSQASDLVRQVDTESVDFAIVVALRKELDALLHYIPELKHINTEKGDVRSYYTAMIPTAGGGCYRIVATLLHSMGNLSAAHATADLIRRWNPRFVLVAGLAGGFKRYSQDFGDIAVSESIVYYELGKVGEDGISRRNKQFLADRTLLDGFLNLNDNSWRTRLPARPDGKSADETIPKIHIGPIASGEKVIASAKEADSIRMLQPNVIAVEMESAGVASAAFSTLKKIGFITVRSICDFADNVKNDNWQTYAACSSASCLRAFIESRPVAPSEGAWPNQPIAPTKADIIELRKRLFNELCKAVDMEDFKNFCFLLGVDIDELPGEKKSARVRELILLFERRNEIDLLLSAFKEFSANDRGQQMTTELPNLVWYLSISTPLQLSPRCPYASVYRCPRFYQSLSLLGNAGSTQIDPKEDNKLKEGWKQTDIWPVTDEQATAISGPKDDSKHFTNFCPEVSYERFGLFATGLHRYADEIDISVAHRQLSSSKVAADDWRWNWSLIEPMHFTGCPLYSLLKAGKSKNEPKMGRDLMSQILQKYEGQRIKADNDDQLEQYFVFNGKLHYLEVEAAQVLEKHNLAPQHLAAEEEIILTQAPRGGRYNALQMDDILNKLNIITFNKSEASSLTKSFEVKGEQAFKYDVFISHASEDKDSFVRPLAEELSFKGVSVWYDEFTLTVGSSLRRSIEKGLIASRHGIVVLSPDFFKKEWPQKELDGLNALEDEVRTVILPIWHKVTKVDVLQYSPILADRVAINTSSGIQHVVSELLKVIRPKDKYEKLLEAAISKWVSHDIFPSVEELYILSENVNPEQLTRDQMSFLYCAFLVRDDEMFEWKERKEPSFSFNYLKGHLFKQANFHEDILSHFHITANKAGILGKDFLAMHGTSLMEDLELKDMVLCLVLLHDDRDQFPAIYLCLQDREERGLEILLVQSTVIKSIVRYMPKHNDESMRQIQLRIIDLH